MLKACDITKIYSTAEGPNTVLDKLCFHGRKGEFCIITGPSGCGKSTLLNVLGCLDTADSGSLEICGKKVLGGHRQFCHIRRNSIGFIFQAYNLISSLTAEENVALALKYKKIPPQKRREMAGRALEQVGLADRKGYLPHQLSGGQQQRVAVARAIVANPAVLFCDEPTGNLDPKSAQVVLAELMRLKRQGTLVVMITHDMSLLDMADRVLRLEKGKLVTMG